MITLLKAGEAFEIVDDGLETRWTIWPFVWRIVGDESTEEVMGEEGWEARDKRLQDLVRLDWEHDSVVFVRPEEVGGMRTVDNLGRSVKAVLDG